MNNGHIYWANFDGGDIRRANLDGTGQQILFSGLSGLAVITLDLSALPPMNIQMAAYRPDSGFTLNWNALMGRAYQVQFNTDLTQTNWINLGLRRTATNTTMSVTRTPRARINVNASWPGVSRNVIDFPPGRST